MLSSTLFNLVRYQAEQKIIREFRESSARTLGTPTEAEGSADAEASTDAGKAEGRTFAVTSVESPAPVERVESSEEAAEEGDVLCILRIPAIDSENPVREGVSGSVLSASLGHQPGTAAPGEGGNCVIAGHRNYTFGVFFNRLDEVVEGDLIYVDTASETYTYSVTEIKVVEPDDLSVLESDPERETLTLYTCTPIYIATHRLVILAERI